MALNIITITLTLILVLLITLKKSIKGSFKVVFIIIVLSLTSLTLYTSNSLTLEISKIEKDNTKMITELNELEDVNTKLNNDNKILDEKLVEIEAQMNDIIKLKEEIEANHAAIKTKVDNLQ